MLTEKKFDKNKCIIFFSVLFIMYLVFSYFVPLSHDDWTWGSIVGRNRLDRWFEDYNGRYLGNIVVIVLTRSKAAKAFVMAFCYTAIIYLVYRICGNRKSEYIITTFLFVLMPTVIFRETIAWVSGFANYAFSMLFILLYIVLINDMYKADDVKNSIIKAIAAIIIGFCGALILETATIYNLFLAVYAIAFVALKFKKVLIQNIAFLIGAAAGTVWMFSNGCYSKAMDGTDFYRTIDTNVSLFSRILKNISAMAFDGFAKNIVLNIALAVILFLVFRANGENYKNRFVKNISLSCLYICGGYAGFGAVFIAVSKNTGSILNGICILYTALFIISLILFLVFLPVEKYKKVKLLFLAFSMLMILGPLLIVTPVNPRCYFGGYIFLMMLAVELYTSLNASDEKIVLHSNRLMLCATIAAGIYLLAIFGSIYIADMNREKSMREQVKNGQTELTLQKLPYAEYVYKADPDGEYNVKNFKRFYRLDKEITFNLK